jgi:small-conductance mechanosensitive channel
VNQTKIKNILNNLQNSFTSPGVYQFLWSLLIIIGGFLLNRLIVRIINKQAQDANRRHVFRKIVNYTVTSLVVIVLLFLWIRNLTYLTALTGFIAAGLAIALRDVLLSFFGWFKIIWSRPFTVGDRIEVRQLQGDIIDITPLHTVILEVGNWVKAQQSTGRIIFIPNNVIFLESVMNSTLGFPYLWDEFSVVITFESNLRVGESLLKDPVEDVVGINYRRARREIQRMGDRYAIQYENLSPRVYTAIKDHGVELTIRYLTRVRGRRETKSRLSKRIMELLQEHPEVELAYPTYRVYRRGKEGSVNTSDEESVPMPPDEPGSSGE